MHPPPHHKHGLTRRKKVALMNSIKHSQKPGAKRQRTDTAWFSRLYDIRPLQEPEVVTN